MKKTLKTILQNSIDEKKYIFKYPITTFKYYDNANFLLVDNIEEDINQIAENKDMEEDYNQNICDYNVERDIERYLEEYNDENIASFMKMSLSLIIGLSNDEKEELRSVYKAKELKPKTIIFMQNIVLKGTENAKKFVRGNLKMLSVEENKNLLEKATKMVLEKKILDIIYIKSIQENRIKDKYLTGVIYNNIEEEIITRMYYNYLFEKIKKLKVRNEYITIKANDSILKYIKGKEDHNLNKIKELYYIREIKILKENKGVNKNINKLEIIIENNERD